MKLYPLMKNHEKYGLSAELNDPSSMPDIQQVGILAGIRDKKTGVWETNNIGDAIDDFAKEPDVIVQNITQKDQTGDLVPKEVFFAPYGVCGRTMDMPTVYGSIQDAHLEIEVTLCDEEGNLRLFTYTAHNRNASLMNLVTDMFDDIAHDASGCSDGDLLGECPWACPVVTMYDEIGNPHEVEFDEPEDVLDAIIGVRVIGIHR